MVRRLLNRVQFEVERFLLYRTLHQFFLIAVIIAFIACVGGIAAWVLTDDFGSIGSAIWWSFLRLTDPGYIGDDVGTMKRTISTVVSILGYVFFLGALVAVMTQGLHREITRLQAGLTPIAQDDHILILGWTNRTPSIVKELLMSQGRVKSFLKRLGRSSLHVVILAEDVTPHMLHELKARVGTPFSGRSVTLRSGNPLRLEHLDRVDFLNASVIILPGGEFGDDALSYPDGRTVKTLLSIRNSARTRLDPDEPIPDAVVEISDHRKAPLARQAYGGSIAMIESDLLVSRLLVQMIRHAGLSHIYYEVLTHEIGNEIYLRAIADLVGTRIGDIPGRFSNAVVLGVYRDDATRFHPLPAIPNQTLRESDRLVTLAPSADSEDVRDELPSEPQIHDHNHAQIVHKGVSRRILILGWNRYAPLVFAGLQAARTDELSVVNLSLITREERLNRLRQAGVEISSLDITYVQGEFTAATDLVGLKPWTFDSVMICSSQWLESSAESDARTVLGFQVLKQLLDGYEQRPDIIAQLMNEDNAQLFPEDQCETIATPVVLSHIIAQVALQRDLRGLYDELFGPYGAEIFFRPVASYCRDIAATSFREIESHALRHNQVAIGLRYAEKIHMNGGVVLNPPKDTNVSLSQDDDVIVVYDPHLPGPGTDE